MDALKFFGEILCFTLGTGFGAALMYFGGLIIDRMVDDGKIPDDLAEEEYGEGRSDNVARSDEEVL